MLLLLMSGHVAVCRSCEIPSSTSRCCLATGSIRTAWSRVIRSFSRHLSHEIVDDVEVVVYHITTGVDVLAVEQGVRLPLRLYAWTIAGAQAVQTTSRGRLLRASNQVTLGHLLARLINCVLPAEIPTELSLMVAWLLIFAMNLGLRLAILVLGVSEIRELSARGSRDWIGTRAAHRTDPTAFGSLLRLLLLGRIGSLRLLLGGLGLGLRGLRSLGRGSRVNEILAGRHLRQCDSMQPGMGQDLLGCRPCIRVCIEKRRY